MYLATEAILSFGSDAQKQRVLPRLATGETIGTLAFAERPGVTDPRKLQAHAADGRLHGTKLAVPDGDVADFAIVATSGDERTPWLHLVKLDGSGVSRTPVATFDPTRSHTRIVFQAAPAEPLPGGQGAQQVRHLLDRAAVLMAFEQVGVAQAALEMARDYALERFAFGRPIGSFQAIKHKLTDIYARLSWLAPTPTTAPGRFPPMPPSCLSRLRWPA